MSPTNTNWNAKSSTERKAVMRAANTATATHDADKVCQILVSSGYVEHMVSALAKGTRYKADWGIFSIEENEDFVADALNRLRGHINDRDREKPIESVGSFFEGICRNLASQEWTRRRSNGSIVISNIEDIRGSDVERISYSPFDKEVEIPDSELSKESRYPQLVELTERIVSALPKSERLVIQYYLEAIKEGRVDDYGHLEVQAFEIADVLAISEVAVRQRKHRAIQTLRAKFGEHGYNLPLDFLHTGSRQTHEDNEE